MRKVQEGFTLIELLIVVAIIGILAAIAIPSYQKYVKKAKFSEVVAATAPFKLGVEACYHEQNSLTSCSNGNNGVPANTGDNGKYVLSIGSTSSAASAIVTGTASDLVDTGHPTVILTGTPGTESNLIDWAKGGTCLTDGFC